MFDCSGKAFIKVYRKFLEWEWYDNNNVKILFLHCLLKANWKATKWHGITIEPGQFITSLNTLSEETRLTVRQVRVALDHLTMTGEVTSKCQSKYRIITVNNWDCYQGNDKVSDKQVTSKRQDDDKQVTTDKEYKEYKEKKEVKNKYICAFDEFWKIYPRKNDKARAYKCYIARLKDGYSEEQLLTACKNYAKACEENKTEQKYIKHGATFLSVNEPFLDYLKGETDAGMGTDTSRDEAEYERQVREQLKRIESGEFDNENLWE